jgi:hypothetical protein
MDLFKRFKKQQPRSESVIYAHDDTVIELPRTEWHVVDTRPERKARRFTPTKEQQL